MPTERGPLLLSWEQTVSNVLHLIRLDSIKRKILVFSLLATLIPSLSMGWLFYGYADQFLTEKVTQDLRTVTAQNVRQLDLWLKERVYEVRVFSSSYVVSENLEKITRGDLAHTIEVVAVRRLKEYLKSVREKFIDYEELMVLSPNGQVIATSAKQVSALSFPPGWQKRAQGDTPILGEAYKDTELNKMAMLIAVPIKAQDSRFLGVLAVKLNFGTIEKILNRSPLGKTGQAYLISQDGTLIASSRSSSSGLTKVKLPFELSQPVSEGETALEEYPDPNGKEVIGTLRRMSQLDWGVVAQIAKEEVYAQTVRIRILTMTICLGLLLTIGLTAYFLGLIIVRPLDRLTNGAAKVAAGDLEVKLSVVGQSEVGYLTEVFNGMVARLREGREELATINQTLTKKNEELRNLSITDSLTGLYNRRHFMEVLANEVARAWRHKHAFSVMMIDTDHFKKYNDASGHQAGDDLLKKIGIIFKESLRKVDCAARYGGDEFIVLLPEVGSGGAFEVADRLRERVAAETLTSETKRAPVTLSIGVAAFPEHGETLEAIVASADSALYHAKRSGRNRVVLASNNLQLGIKVAN
jgi:diguanylate cyclase (GGDEF)-like protein